ncbi:MAG: TIGR01777 family oxidoreductase [Solirubrobacterales bacterium]|nr:TIGR01777 family oxidoreductase [Solirubrobacterales bacterium]
MNITVTGATGMIGRKLVAALKERGDEVTVLSRNPQAAETALGVKAIAWTPESEQAPIDVIAASDAVIHLAGESVAQRWTAKTKASIRSSRVDGTANLVSAMRQAEVKPQVFISGSAVGWYGPRDESPVTEGSSAGEDFLAQVCVDWENAAQEAVGLGIRTVILRTGVVLSPDGGALARMLPPFKAGVGGPVAGGKQMVPWIHIDDIVGLILASLDGDERWSGVINATAPHPVSNTDLSKALGRVLRRPALAPVPALAIKALYGEMAQIVTTGQNAVPARATELGFQWKQPDLEGALRQVLSR